MEEKRKHPRIKANVLVSYKVKTSRLLGGSHIKDISESGIGLPSKHYFPIDTILELEVKSDDFKEPLKALAKVVRIANLNNNKFQFEVGVEFLDLTPARRNMLHDYISQAIAQGVDQNITWFD